MAARRVVVREVAFEDMANAIFGRSALADESLRALEWDLTMRPSLDAYTLVAMAPSGPMRLAIIPPTPAFPKCAVLFIEVPHAVVFVAVTSTFPH